MITRVRSRALAVASPLLALALLLSAWPQAGLAKMRGGYEKRSEEYKWRLCPAPFLVPQAPEYSDSEIDPEDTEVRADSARMLDSGLSQFAGDVEVVRSDNALQADIVSYDSVHNLFFGEGRAHIWDPNFIWEGTEFTYDVNGKVSDLSEGRFWVKEGRGRGHADTLHIDHANKLAVLKGVRYSTCPLSDEVWNISASTIKLNHVTQRGSATNAVLRIRDTPVFYFPYVSFPLVDERKSGFLTPTFGSSSRSGYDVRQPYYVNIAPNQDATITPRILGDRGVMLMGEYRYLLPDHEGHFAADFLPSDRLKHDDDRSAFTLNHTSMFDERQGRVHVLVNNVSDSHFFEDFGTSLAATSQRFLDRRADFYYAKPTYRIDGIVQAYQTIDNSILPGNEPYQRLPQVRFQGRTPRLYGGFAPELVADTTYFNRDATVSGTRVDFQPGVSYPITTSYLDIVPKLVVADSEYYLDDPGHAFNSHVSRTVPIFSVDSRVYVERNVELFGHDNVQTIEPRLYYLLIPKVSQNDIPLFDTAPYSVSFGSLFYYNRFAGQDRIGDANQVAMAMTSRMMDVDSGRELYRVNLGQIYYVQKPQVFLPNQFQTHPGESELVADATTAITAGLSAHGVVQWDPHTETTELAAGSLRYRPDLDTVVNVGYRFRRATTDIRQTDVSLRLPLGDRVGLVGRWNYSLEEQRSLETLAGVELEGCCWAVRVVGRRFLRNASHVYDTGVFAQIEFRGLGGLGKSAGALLHREIPGFADPFE